MAKKPLTGKLARYEELYASEVFRSMSIGAQAILQYLFHRANKQGWAWPAQTKIAEVFGISERAVSRHIFDLADHGLIRIEKRPGEWGNAKRYQVWHALESHTTEMAGEIPSHTTDLVISHDRSGQTHTTEMAGSSYERSENNQEQHDCTTEGHEMINLGPEAWCRHCKAKEAASGAA